MPVIEKIIYYKKFSINYRKIFHKLYISYYHTNNLYLVGYGVKSSDFPFQMV